MRRVVLAAPQVPVEGVEAPPGGDVPAVAEAQVPPAILTILCVVLAKGRDAVAGAYSTMYADRKEIRTKVERRWIERRRRWIRIRTVHIPTELPFCMPPLVVGSDLELTFPTCGWNIRVS